jgi:hypothetical protein
MKQEELTEFICQECGKKIKSKNKFSRWIKCRCGGDAITPYVAGFKMNGWKGNINA